MTSAPEFTVEVDQNPYLAVGARRVDAVTVTASGPDAAPVDALEIVIVDCSGSMAGAKMRHAQQATIAAIDRGPRRRVLRRDRRHGHRPAGVPGSRDGPRRRPYPRGRRPRRCSACAPTGRPRSGPGCGWPAGSPTRTRARCGTRSC